MESSGSQWNSVRKRSVLLVAVVVQRSQRAGFNGSSRSSSKASCSVLFGRGGGNALVSEDASRVAAGSSPRCSRQSVRRRVAANGAAVYAIPHIVEGRERASSIMRESSESCEPSWERSFRFAEPMIATVSSAMRTCGVLVR